MTTSLILSIGLAACGNHGHDHDARVVARTIVCETIEARPGIFVRISRFRTDQFFSHSPRVLSICNNRGGCNAKAWFDGPYAPNIRSTPDGGLRIEIAGIAHRVFPDHAVTERVDVQFTDTRGMDGVQIGKRFKPQRCSDPTLASRSKPGA